MRVLAYLTAASCAAAATAAYAQTRPAGDLLVLAATTSVEDSSLFDSLIPRFRASSGFEIHVVSRASSTALTTAEHGTIDVVIVNDPEALDRFVAAGDARGAIASCRTSLSSSVPHPIRLALAAPRTRRRRCARSPASARPSCRAEIIPAPIRPSSICGRRQAPTPRRGAAHLRGRRQGNPRLQGERRASLYSGPGSDQLNRPAARLSRA